MSQPAPADFWTAAAVTKKIFETKLCLAGRHLSDCKGPIIRAHTLPRSQLKRIARFGHVYSVAATAGDLARRTGQLTARSVGIKEFSVLNCFCEKHDSALFAPLERVPLEFNPHQLTLLHYRAVASELYRKEMAYHALTQRIARPTDEERIVLDVLQDAATGQLLGIRDIGVAFDRCAENLTAGRYDDVSGMVVYFARMPSVMTTGSFVPEYDYNSAPSQLLFDANLVGHLVSFSILASDGRAAVCMVWFKEHASVRQFAKSFIAQPQAHYTTLAIQTAFEHLETTCVNPNWWDDLRPVESSSLLRRMQSGIPSSTPRANNCLSFGGIIFEDWDYDRHEILNI